MKLILSRRKRLLNLLNTLQNDLLVTELAEKSTHPTRIITIAEGRLNPILPEAKILIVQMIKNIEEELQQFKKGENK